MASLRIHSVLLMIVQDYKPVTDAEDSKRRGIPHGAPFKLLKHDFVLLSEQEAKEAEKAS